MPTEQEHAAQVARLVRESDHWMRRHNDLLRQFERFLKIISDGGLPPDWKGETDPYVLIDLMDEADERLDSEADDPTDVGITDKDFLETDPMTGRYRR